MIKRYYGKELFGKSKAELKSIGIYPGKKLYIMAVSTGRVIEENENYNRYDKNSPFFLKIECYVLFTSGKDCKFTAIEGKVFLSFSKSSRSRVRFPYEHGMFNYTNDEAFRNSLINIDDNTFTRSEDLTNKRYHWMLEGENIIEVQNSVGLDNINSKENLINNINFLKDTSENKDVEKISFLFEAINDT
jgi:hypothetical protein